MCGPHLRFTAGDDQKASVEFILHRGVERLIKAFIVRKIYAANVAFPLSVRWNLRWSAAAQISITSSRLTGGGPGGRGGTSSRFISRFVMLTINAPNNAEPKPAT